MRQMQWRRLRRQRQGRGREVDDGTGGDVNCSSRGGAPLDQLAL